MIKFLAYMNITLMVAVAWLYFKPPVTLFDKVVLDPIECPGMNGYGASVLGVGATTKANPDKECIDQANATLMLAAGMPDNARISACQSASSMRNYATVDNCMNANTYGYRKIVRDVQTKSSSCGGKPSFIHWIKAKKYWKCMGALS